MTSNIQLTKRNRTFRRTSTANKRERREKRKREKYHPMPETPTEHSSVRWPSLVLLSSMHCYSYSCYRRMGWLKRKQVCVTTNRVQYYSRKSTQNQLVTTAKKRVLSDERERRGAGREKSRSSDMHGKHETDSRLPCHSIWDGENAATKTEFCSQTTGQPVISGDGNNNKTTVIKWASGKDDKEFGHR